jgi:hypothetical protein
MTIWKKLWLKKYNPYDYIEIEKDNIYIYILKKIKWYGEIIYNGIYGSIWYPLVKIDKINFS